MPLGDDATESPSTLMAVWSSIAYVGTGTPAAHFSTFAMELSSKMGSGLSTCTHVVKSTRPIARSLPSAMSLPWGTISRFHSASQL